MADLISRFIGRGPIRDTDGQVRMACHQRGITGAVLILVGLLGIPPFVAAGQFNAVLSIGDPAPQWQGLEGTDGNKHRWEDLADAKCVVVAFTCNSCPYARDVEDRLNALTQQFASSEVRLVAINVNLVAEDSMEAMKQRSIDQGFSYPYLHDPSQAIAKAYGAIKTPEFFVLDGDGKVVYMGALDDSPDGKQVTQHYVADAVAAVLSGTEPKTTETVPIGCRIRYVTPKRER